MEPEHYRNRGNPLNSKKYRKIVCAAWCGGKVIDSRR